MDSVNGGEEEKPEDEAGSVEEGCPFAVTAYENADKSNVEACVFHHVGGVACDELKSINLCPLSETGASKELINRRVTA